jgi:hypothetical protein
MARRAVKGAKLAIDGTDVGVVDVSVNKVCHVSFWMHG